MEARSSPGGWADRVRPAALAALPWVLAVGAAFFAAIALNASAPEACDELPRPFTAGVTTTYSGDPMTGTLVSHCEYTVNATGETVGATVVNWSGIGFGLGLIAGAWLLGAGLARRVSLRTATAGVAVSAAICAIALATLYL